MTSEENALRITMLVPVYNDWECVSELLARLDSAIGEAGIHAKVVLIDDYSTVPAEAGMKKTTYASLVRVDCLRLRRNLGHQRAISIGLCFIQEKQACDAVVVMDGDGEDRPEDVPRLIQQFRKTGGQRVVFAKRMRRSEGFVFTTCYHAYRLLHWLLTGVGVRFGNFSIVPYEKLGALVVVTETWNHYAAAVVKARIPYDMLETERGQRYAGVSKLNSSGLVLHGLSAISVFMETVGVRLIMATAFIASLVIAILLAALSVRLFTNLAIAGWATNAVGLLVIILLQLFLVAVGLTLAVLANRNNLSFLPIRDYHNFVDSFKNSYERST